MIGYMFTGIVEAKGTVYSSTQEDGNLVLMIETPVTFLADGKIGESVSVNGVCLTVIEIGALSFTTEVMDESLRLTTLGQLEKGSAVNLERSLRTSDRLGGHIVQGHVDGVGEVESVQKNEGSTDVCITFPKDLARYISKKGAISVNGVSLTVTQVGDSSFCTSLIPHTLEVTNLSDLEQGSEVNLEIDMFARYLDRYMEVLNSKK